MTARLSTYEHHIEDFLARTLTEAGHLCLKFLSPGFPGVPDRVVLTNDGRVLFIECKAPGRGMRHTQPKVLELLRKMGHRVEVVDTLAQVQQLAQELSAP